MDQPHVGASGERSAHPGEGTDRGGPDREHPRLETPTPAFVAVARFARAVAARPREGAVLGVVMIVAIVAGYIFGGAGASMFLGVLTAVAAANWIIVRERRDRVRRGEGRIMW